MMQKEKRFRHGYASPYSVYTLVHYVTKEAKEAEVARFGLTLKEVEERIAREA